jgi:hypothetical protein
VHEISTEVRFIVQVALATPPVASGGVSNAPDPLPNNVIVLLCAWPGVDPAAHIVSSITTPTYIVLMGISLGVESAPLGARSPRTGEGTRVVQHEAHHPPDPCHSRRYG